MENYYQELKSFYEKKDYKSLQDLIKILERNKYPKSILDFYKSNIPAYFDENNISKTIKYDNESNFNFDINSKLGCISKIPLVSIIIVSYNSSKDLKLLIPTIISQTYTNFEVIVVDNGNDETKEVCENLLANFEYLKYDNIGFADANNKGLSKSNGELILLLNPDTLLDKNTLKNLVFNFRVDASAAAVCPKIYFYEEFQKLNFRSSDITLNFKINLSSIINKFPYKKYFLREGLKKEDDLIESINGLISIDIPIPKSFEKVILPISKLINDDKDFYVVADFDNYQDKLISPKITSNKIINFELNLKKSHHSSSRLLINNAGSGIRNNGQLYDIGFGEPEEYQHDSKIYVDAFCGCCVLLRRDLFIKRKIFISEFFAYFEDSELSNWIKENKMRILYVPSAKVYHKHSESTNENSIIWNTLVSRSKKIYDSIVNNDENFILNIDENKYLDLPKTLSTRLTNLDKQLKNKTKSTLINYPKKTVGIYNSYWNTFGGGEKHALDFAAILNQKGYEVFLISESDFDIKKLALYFGLNLENVTKLVSGTVTSSLTSRFDVFINSTYNSNLLSFAKKSYYIVSFPHPTLDQKFISNYHFLYNSDFTKKWAYKLWKEDNGTIIYPTLGFKTSNYLLSDYKKNKYILNVGRFNLKGHCKNQHLIAKAFKNLILNNRISEEWKLIFIGSVDEKSNSSIEHLDLTKSNSYEKNTEFLINAKRKTVSKYYKESGIYIHATGLGIDDELNPEKCEHYGISTFEAIYNGCIPITYSKGGPFFQIKNIKNSFSFNNEAELEESLVLAVNLFNSSKENNIVESIAKIGQEDLKQNFRNMNKLFYN